MDMQKQCCPEEAVQRLPRLGAPAPEFEAVTTQGPVKLTDYRGSWLVLFSHPADFTPVCTTEFVGFTEIANELQELNCKLLGLSIDSLFSHIAWLRNIEEKMGVKVPFPVIADLSQEVSRKYGMVMEDLSDTEAARCVFVIDPDGIVQAMIYYPMSTGRNMAEIVRLVKALQTSAKHKVATPANWQPKDPVIVPPPRTQVDAEKRLNEGYDCKDWYLCKKTI
ncbi:MAG: peroxiredoxin [Limnochordia bacterium]|jgi:peroxiredoxin (alkyl hydroperoxide reductase subunit C)